MILAKFVLSYSSYFPFAKDTLLGIALYHNANNILIETTSILSGIDKSIIS
ncbi:hypothetical protein rpr22_0308 [Rickettsia prowazekii str. Rp22]|uniref:Uncharacterized protein n=1 Tax=Rickettsia prowazekii (strain Rp22) TaxID=449216 RepID=D5AWL9_RICPP|nr:hypothetical protein rpr22_0308 [Rickettsia prowazekii str. Rp22]AGJ02073.1 hypothetical protein H374_7880 [Rickettsia prowazekii str. NMRC Madrid E]AGJ02546.1 hypothetical protein H375_3200 [Rickettsia prowazekii str. Breinl]EOB09650.1 hypothetical protein H376_5950 [Rickettsia prowazekii str. GvF12]EOB10408.1 hypothetical protein H377_3820 [Rickettsia prowazekii str. Cairo 3]